MGNHLHALSHILHRMKRSWKWEIILSKGLKINIELLPGA